MIPTDPSSSSVPGAGPVRPTDPVSEASCGRDGGRHDPPVSRSMTGIALGRDAAGLPVPPGRRPTLLIVAGEASGDVYTSTLIDVLLQRADFNIFAVGGRQTARRPVRLLFDSSDWAAIGYVEAIKRFPQLYLILQRLCRFLRHRRPDLVILVDYPGFNMRLARYAKQLGIPTLHYFPPSKFARDPRDVADAARTLTAVAATFSFTHEVYRAAGAISHFVGHPLLDIARPSLSRDDACRMFGIEPDRPIVSLCPGSRRSEIDQLLPVMLEAGKLLVQRRPELQFLVPVIASHHGQVYGYPLTELRRKLVASGLTIQMVEGRPYDVMALSELLLISSGTATLEASHIGTPMVIVYRVSWFTEMIANHFNKIPNFIGLPNIFLGRMAVPELIQHRLTPDRLAAVATELLENPAARARQKADLAEVMTHLGKPGAHGRVADLVLQMLGMVPPPPVTHPVWDRTPAVAVAPRSPGGGEGAGRGIGT